MRWEGKCETIPDYSGLQVQDARRLRPFPHQLRHLRGRLPRRSPQLFGREVRAQGPHARRRQVREQQGTEGTELGGGPNEGALHRVGLLTSAAYALGETVLIQAVCPS